MREKGYEPLVIAPAASPLLEKARSAGLAAAAVSPRTEWDVIAARRIRARLRAWRPDIVHAHDARSHAIALMALGRSQIPLVVTRRVAFAPKLARLKYGARVARFVAISYAVKSAMTEAGIDPSRIDVVYSGIATPDVKDVRNWRKELGWPDEIVVCGVVGAMTGEKGIDLIGRIVELLPREIQDKCGVVFLGANRPQHADEIAIRAHWAGFIENILEAMAGLDLLWHPARSEGLGTSVLDALALGVPPIAFAAGGLAETIENERCGILVPPGNIREFALAIERLVSDSAYRKRLASNARERARKFSDRAMIENNIAVYHKVIQGSA